jgi:nucleotide-binding universal stress UspA family protein
VSVRKILVGGDASEGTRAALRWAAELAADLRARVVVVHAFEPLAHLEELGPGADLVAARERAEAELRGSVCEDLRARGVEHEARLREGLPARVLIDVADEVDADLIVVGARRRGPWKKLLLGSTSSALPQLTSRPVVVVHERSDRREPG